MAGIEKVCEYSGEQCGWDMYAYKHNHIQIHPRYRKEFRGANHTLFILSSEPYFELNGGGLMNVDPMAKHSFDPPFATDNDYIEHMKRNGSRLVNMVSFNLRVDDPSLAGNVNGNYRERTTDLKSLKRRLKRMLRCKELNIVDFHHSEHYDNALEVADQILGGDPSPGKMDRKACKKAVDDYQETLMSEIHDAVTTGDRNCILNAIRQQDLFWVAFAVATQDKYRIILDESRFRDSIKETFPWEAKILGWL